jgi:hypothetical protein
MDVMQGLRAAARDAQGAAAGEDPPGFGVGVAKRSGGVPAGTDDVPRMQVSSRSMAAIAAFWIPYSSKGGPA